MSDLSNLEFVNRAYRRARAAHDNKDNNSNSSDDEVARVLNMTRRELVDLCKDYKRHHGQRCNASSDVLRHLARLLREIERLKASCHEASEKEYDDFIPVDQIREALGEDLVNLIMTLCPVSYDTVLRLVYMDHFMNLDAVRALSNAMSAEPYQPFSPPS